MIAAAIAAIIGGTTLWVLAPLLGWTSEEEVLDAAAEEQEKLLAARRELLASIKDLEMEHQVGKLTREDYEETREKLTREAVEVLRRLDRQEAPGTRTEEPESAPEDR